jgi:hypothetical protein
VQKSQKHPTFRSKLISTSKYQPKDDYLKEVNQNEEERNRESFTAAAVCDIIICVDTS